MIVYIVSRYDFDSNRSLIIGVYSNKDTADGVAHELGMGSVHHEYDSEPYEVNED